LTKWRFGAKSLVFIQKMNKKLTEKQISIIVEFLKEEKPLLEEYRWLLFEGKWETELIYAAKTRDVDVLTETMAVPLQKVKVFGNIKIPFNGDD